MKGKHKKTKGKLWKNIGTLEGKTKEHKKNTKGKPLNKTKETQRSTTGKTKGKPWTNKGN